MSKTTHEKLEGIFGPISKSTFMDDEYHPKSMWWVKVQIFFLTIKYKFKKR